MRKKREYSAMSVSLVALLSCQCSPSVCNSKASVSGLDCASACKVLPLHHTSFAAFGNVVPPLGCLLALSIGSIAVFGPFQPGLAETVELPYEEISVSYHTSQRLFEGGPDMSAEAPCLQALNCLTAEEMPTVAAKAYSPVWKDEFLAKRSHYSFNQSSSIAEDYFQDSQTSETDSQSSPINVSLVHSQALSRISSSTAEQSSPVLDFAGVLSPAKANSLLSDIHILEAEAGWRLRVITKSGSSSSISGKDLKDLWKPDAKTVIVFEDLSSPNIINFNAGADVIVKLPRQFFVELQSRYGNQFYVQQEGEGVALMSTVQAIQECLSRPEGCKSVPGLTNDLYYLTLVTSIVGGCVFGFAARLPPSGRVEASWQWVVFLSPLWLLLFVSFGVLPVVGRTSELEPLLKNTLGFCAGAVALYLTPIFGPSPISKRQ